jgi:hypothetical protein
VLLKTIICTLVLTAVVVAVQYCLRQLVLSFGDLRRFDGADGVRGLCMGLARSAAIAIADCRPISWARDEPDGGFIRVKLRPPLKTSPTR